MSFAIIWYHWRSYIMLRNSFCHFEKISFWKSSFHSSSTYFQHCSNACGSCHRIKEVPFSVWKYRNDCSNIVDFGKKRVFGTEVGVLKFKPIFSDIFENSILYSPSFSVGISITEHWLLIYALDYEKML